MHMLSSPISAYIEDRSMTYRSFDGKFKGTFRSCLRQTVAAAQNSILYLPGVDKLLLQIDILKTNEGVVYV